MKPAAQVAYDALVSVVAGLAAAATALAVALSLYFAFPTFTAVGLLVRFLCPLAFVAAGAAVLPPPVRLRAAQLLLVACGCLVACTWQDDLLTGPLMGPSGAGNVYLAAAVVLAGAYTGLALIWFANRAPAQRGRGSGQE